jgi:GNAT superfamily N-acetyltransferase
MYEFRKATLGDIEALARTRVRFLCDGRDDLPHLRKKLLENNVEFFLSAMSDDSFIAWVAVYNGEIIATSGLTIYNIPPNRVCPTGKVAYLSNMFTISEYRRQGIGSKLLDLIMDEARSYGCERVILNATSLGRGLYEKYGFMHSEDSMWYYPGR